MFPCPAHIELLVFVASGAECGCGLEMAPSADATPAADVAGRKATPSSRRDLYDNEEGGHGLQLYIP